MPVIRDNKGDGLVTARRARAGELQDTMNFLLGNREGAPRAEVRKYIKRFNDTRRSNDKVFMLFEFRDDSGNKTKLVKDSSGDLFDLADPATALLTGLNTAGLADACNGNDLTFIADNGAAFYRYDDDHTNTVTDEVVEANKGGSITPSETGAPAATGFGTGTFEYQFTDFDPVLGQETILSVTASVTKANANTGVRISQTGLSFANPYTQKRIYRRLRDNNNWFLIATAGSGDFPVDDSTLELNLTAASSSEVHDNLTGLANNEIPAAPVSCTFHRGRLFSLSGDELRWSKIDLFFIFKKNGEATKQIGDDGDEGVRVLTWGESLIIFKRNSTWVMNGDVDEAGFVFYPASRTIGAISRFAIAKTPIGVIFVGNDYQIYNFDLTVGSLLQPIVTSTGIDFSNDASIDWTKADLFSAGWDPFQNVVYITFLDSSEEPTTYSLFLDGMKFGKFEASMNVVKPRYWAELTNSASERKLHFGDQQGYVYETETNTSADGPPSGTVTGTITSSTTTTITDSAATFFITGDDLLGFSVVVDNGDGTFTEKIIQSNTADTITVTVAFSIAPGVGLTYYIAPMHTLYFLGAIDDDNPFIKKFQKMFVTVNDGNGTFRFGSDLNDTVTRSDFRSVAI